MKGRTKQALLLGAAALLLVILNGRWIARLPAAAHEGTPGILWRSATPNRGTLATGPRSWSTYQPASIVKLSAGGAAARAGLRKGDQVVAINGIPTYYQEELGRLFDASHPGTNMEYTVLRGTGKQVVRFRLDGRLSQFDFWLPLLADSCSAGFFFGLGAFVYWKRPKDRCALMFFVMCLPFAFFFSLSNVLTLEANGVKGVAEMGAVMLTAALAGTIFLFPPLLHFMLIFPKPRPLVEKYPGILGWVYGLAALITVLFGTLFIVVRAGQAGNMLYGLGYGVGHSGRLAPWKQKVEVILLLAPVVFCSGGA